MIHYLNEYAQCSGLLAEAGFGPKVARVALVFDAAGTFVRVHDFGKDGRKFVCCPHLQQPELVGTKGRHFLLDNVGVVSLYFLKPADTTREEKKRTDQHEAFVGLLRQAAKVDPRLEPVAAQLLDPRILEQIQEELAQAKVRDTESATLEVGGELLVDGDSWHEWWRSYRAGIGAAKGGGPAKKGQRMRSLSSGKLVDAVSTHVKIRGLSDVGGLGTGDVLAGFDKAAYASYGLVKAANAAMAEAEVAVYAAALNQLIAQQSQRVGPAKVVYWYTGTVEPEEDPFPALIEGFGAPEDDTTETDESSSPKDSTTRESLQATHRVAELLDAIRSGRRPDLATCRYRALTLSGASGRVMIRDWMEGQFEELLGNVKAWFDDLTIVRSFGGGLESPPKLFRLLCSLVRDPKDIVPTQAALLWRVALRGEAIPTTLLAKAVERARIDTIKDERPNPTRWGLMKAYHIRRGDTYMRPTVNEEHPSPAYHCGRLMAVLAYVQWKALGDVGAGVVQRYYAAASATPALVLGRLVRGAQFHMNKIEKSGWIENRISEIMLRLGSAIPTTLTLEEQSLFALGYYQQKAARGGSAAVEEDTAPAEE